MRAERLDPETSRPVLLQSVLRAEATVGDLAQGAKRVRLAEIALDTGLVQRHDMQG
ncbi:MAG: hypothetical protein ACRDKY_02165 [Solirubrobacteraceae bacterium]